MPRSDSRAATFRISRPPRFQHPEHLADRVPLDVVRKRIDHVERRHQVEPGGGEGEPGRRGPGDLALPLGPRVLKSGPCQVDTVSTAVFPEHGQVVPGAAAAIKDLGTDPLADPSDGAGNQRFDEPAEAAEPEVIALGACGGL